MTEVSDSLRSTISGAATRARTQVETRIDGALSLSEKTVDRLLPAERSCAEEIAPTSTTTFSRISGVGNCFRQRLSTKLVQQLDAVQPAKLKEMSFTVDLIQYAQKSLEQQRAWLKETLATPVTVSSVSQSTAAAVAPLTQSLHHATSAAYSALSSAAHRASDTSVRVLRTVVEQVKSHTPAAITENTAAAHTALLARINELSRVTKDLPDDSFVKRLLGVTEDTIAYLKDVEKALRGYYASARSAVAAAATNATAAAKNAVAGDAGVEETVVPTVNAEEEEKVEEEQQQQQEESVVETHQVEDVVAETEQPVLELKVSEVDA